MKVETSFLFFVIFILFLLSASVLVFGFFRPRVSVNNKGEVREAIEREKKEEDLTEYFDKQFSKETNGKDDEFFGNDPFKEICKGEAGGKSPYIKEGTVCLR